MSPQNDCRTLQDLLANIPFHGSSCEKSIRNGDLMQGRRRFFLFAASYFKSAAKHGSKHFKHSKHVYDFIHEFACLNTFYFGEFHGSCILIFD